MLGAGDLNLNHLGGDSVREALRDTMLHHEITFRHQVRELHRLYWTQKNLMREVYQRELEAKQYKQALPLQSHQPHGMGFAKEGGNVGSFAETEGKFVGIGGKRCRGFDLEIRGDVYTGNSSISSMRDELVIGSEMVRPRFGGVGANAPKGGGMRPLVDKGKNLFCYEVIDLEEPAEVESRGEAHGMSFNGFKIPVDNCGGVGSSRSEVASEMGSSNRVQNESAILPDLNHLHPGCSERWPNHKADPSGSGGSESSVASLIDMSAGSTNKRLPISAKTLLIDLNVSQDDESSRAPNDPMLTFSSPSSCSSKVHNEIIWREQGNRYPKDSSAIPGSEAPHRVSRGKNVDWLFFDCKDPQRSNVSDVGIEKNTEAGNKAQDSNSTGLTECCRKPPGGSSSGSNGENGSPNNGEGLGNLFRDLNMPVEENEDFSSGRLDAVAYSGIRHASIAVEKDIAGNKQPNHLGSEDEDTVSSHAVAQDLVQQDVRGKFLAGSKCDGNIDCTSSDNVVEGSSETSQLDNTAATEQQQQHEEDHAVIDAAQILAGISLASPSPLVVKQFHNTVPEETLSKENDGDKPEYSCDSFEAMTLQLPEVSSDQHVTGPGETESKDEAVVGPSNNANRLRRGRGRAVRDFQKDILPGMVSLSRHEICEDMHSIGYELRKNSSRRNGGGNWFVPVRSRRSRRVPAGRRQ